MKKKFFAPLMGAVVLGLSAYAGYRTYNAYAEVTESDLLLANIEALADDGEHSGGTANSHCPIWNVTIETGGGLLEFPKVTCSTGGDYKCNDGKCPHEK